MTYKIYVLRDENGRRIVELDEGAAAMASFELIGYWRPYKAKGRDETRCFEFTSDQRQAGGSAWMTLRDGHGGAASIRVFAGYKLVEVVREDTDDVNHPDHHDNPIND